MGKQTSNPSGFSTGRGTSTVLLQKRAAEDDSGSGPTTRSAKALKTEQASPARGPRGARGRRGGPKANLAASAFKARALPLHVNVTHTPPVLADDGSVSLASTDPGFISTATLLPSSFATGSYGWKGSKRITIELQNPEDGGEGEKEKVHVMLTINATVMGSKNAAEGDGEADAEADGETKAEGGEDAAEAAAEEEAQKAVEQAVAEEKEVADEKKEINGEAAAVDGDAKEPAPMEDVKEGE
ncbi:hypothetical protein BN946_scf185000.g67 [Trametes cinnabarina]|uniref:Uncharacterized protein n=1 Tax=Pycnoporus cinnabarinus TaxID=5643 RepID=A0A060S9H5_PYCCI|nr:hypothetical protein BN946_scf185000.g67 [Trametes cinnabarina]